MTFPAEIDGDEIGACLSGPKMSEVDCTVIGQEITVTFTSISEGTGVFGFYIEDIRNPPSLEPSGTFTNIITYDSKGGMVSQYPVCGETG